MNIDMKVLSKQDLSVHVYGVDARRRLASSSLPMDARCLCGGR